MNSINFYILIISTWKSIYGSISIKGYGSSKVNSQFVLACYIPTFSGATWSTSNVNFSPITCTSSGFCDTVSRDNYRFIGNASGIFVIINPLQHKDNQIKWTCYFASTRISYTIKIKSELPSSEIDQEAVLNGGQIAGIIVGCVLGVILIIATAFCIDQLRKYRNSCKT